MRYLLLSSLAITFFALSSFGQCNFELVKKGDAYMHKEKFRDAISSYDAFLNGCDSYHDTTRLEILLNKSKAYAILEDRGKSIKFLKEAKSLTAKIKSDDYQAKVLVRIAEFYRDRGKYNKSKEVLREAKQIIDRGEVSRLSEAHYYNRFAAVLNEISGKPDSVILLSEKALEIATELNNQHLIATSLNEIAFTQEHYGDLKESIRKYERAAQIWVDAQMNRYAANAYANLSRAYFKHAKLDLGLQATNDGLAIADSNWYSVLIGLYEYKATILIDMGRYKEAIESLGKKSTCEFKQRELEWTKELALVEGELKLEKEYKRGQKALQEKEVAKFKLKNERSRKNFLLILLVVVLALLVVIGVFVIRYIKSNKQLKKSIESKELLLREVHHRVKNNMQMVSSLVELQSSFVNDKVALGAMDDIQNRIQSLAMAHQTLYLEKDVDRVGLDKYIRSIVGAVCPDDVETNISVPAISFSIEKAQSIGFVVNELLLNSVKHAWTDEREKRVEIEIEEKENNWELRYFDNGRGVEFVNHFLESSTFGITLIKSIIKNKLKGTMEVLETEGFGLVIIMEK